MTNNKLLKSKMVLHGLTASDVAEKLEISRQSFSYKVNGKRPFVLREIEILRDLLALEPKDVMDIFFANDVDETATVE